MMSDAVTAVLIWIIFSFVASRAARARDVVARAGAL